MDAYLWLKYVHIVNSTILFGTGIGSAFYMLRANMSKDVPSIYFTARNVVLADWLFTTPSVIIQLATGLAMVYISGIPLTEGWVVWGIVLYLLAGACWLPVVYIQIRLRDMAKDALASSSPLLPLYWRLEKIWFCLGMIAFPAIVVVYYLMVFKPAL